MPVTGREEISAAISVLRNGSLTSSAAGGGERVQEFEATTTSFVKSRYAIAVNSGTAALQASLYALGIKEGDEVLIPSFTFVATANAIVSVGARPVFVDILKENYTMDPSDLEKKITAKTSAIMPVHLYGNAAYVEEISEVSKKHNLPVIEDAAQSLGTTYKARQTGTFFEMGCYSMYPAKVMTAGEGGLVVTNDKRLRDRLLMIRNHGMVRGYDTRILGLNLRLPEISAAIATVQLKKLPGFIKTRKRNALLLSEMVSDMGGYMIDIPSPRQGEEPNWYLYTITAKRRNRLLKRLNAEGIGAAAYYSTPVHKTPFYSRETVDANITSTTDGLPVTDWAASHVISLPIHPKVTRRDIAFIARVLHENS